jgi:hypothetical protein
MFVAHVVKHHPDSDLTDEEKTAGAEDFFAEPVRYMRTLTARHDKDSPDTTGSLREQRGGNIALRGIGMFSFARALLYCEEHNIDFDDMAKALGKIDRRGEPDPAVLGGVRGNLELSRHVSVGRTGREGRLISRDPVVDSRPSLRMYCAGQAYYGHASACSWVAPKQSWPGKKGGPKAASQAQSRRGDRAC